MAPQALVQGFDRRIVLAPALPRVCGHPNRLRQILLSLVGNPVTLTEQGSVRISASASDDEVSVAICHTGNGIVGETLPLIFEAFRLVDSSLTRRHGGAGLGLAVAYKLAGQMGGTITLLSRPAVGSTFALHLPRHAETHQTAR